MRLADNNYTINLPRGTLVLMITLIIPYTLYRTAQLMMRTE